MPLATSAKPQSVLVDSRRINRALYYHGTERALSPYIIQIHIISTIFFLLISSYTHDGNLHKKPIWNPMLHEAITCSTSSALITISEVTRKQSTSGTHLDELWVTIRIGAI